MARGCPRFTGGRAGSRRLRRRLAAGRRSPGRCRWRYAGHRVREPGGIGRHDGRRPGGTTGTIQATRPESSGCCHTLGSSPGCGVPRPAARHPGTGPAGAAPIASARAARPANGGMAQVTQVPTNPADPAGPPGAAAPAAPGEPARRAARANGTRRGAPGGWAGRARRAPDPGAGREAPGQPGAAAAGAGFASRAARTALAEADERPAPAPERPAPPEGSGPVEWVMSTVIRKLSWSRLSDPRVAISVSGLGLLLGMLVGATAPNAETLPEPARLPLSRLLPSLVHHPVLAMAMTYSGDVLACAGLAGMLWAHSQGWRPDPRRLLLVSAAIVAVMVSLTPVGSSDTASYAAYGRIAALGGNPYTHGPAWLGAHSPYLEVVGWLWKSQPSVYGPFATVIQSFAASIGGANAATTIWVLMILNGAVFIGVGWLLLKTSDDPVRATLFWTANPVLIQQLVSGGHLDTFVAAAAICAIQVARRVTGIWGDVLVGVLIGIGCGIKISAVLIGIGLAWPLLRQREWLRTGRIAAVALATLALLYSPYLLNARDWASPIKPLFQGSKWVTLPAPLWFLHEAGRALGAARTMAVVISVIWLAAMFVVAWLVHQRISSDQ